MKLPLASEERRQIARLFNFLLQGEQLAFDCASKQSMIFDDRISRRFLKAQARQEALHAKIFKAGIGILTPRGIGEPLAKKQMNEYRRLLEANLEHGHRAESLLGMQIIFEGLGDITLTRISDGFPTRGLAFRRVRHLIVGQEDAHHSFGLRRFQQELGSTNRDINKLIHQSQLHLEVLDTILIAIRSFFEYFEEDAGEYLGELIAMMPDNLSRSAA
jgi:hypothetical protein